MKHSQRLSQYFQVFLLAILLGISAVAMADHKHANHGRHQNDYHNERQCTHNHKHEYMKHCRKAKHCKHRRHWQKHSHHEVKHHHKRRHEHHHQAMRAIIPLGQHVKLIFNSGRTHSGWH